MIEITRTTLGRPKITGTLHDQVAVSLTHDQRYCIGVAGEHEQGVDVEVVTQRSEDEWRALLGPAQHALLAELARGEPLHRAGTRIWAALECVYKALGAREAELAVARRAGDAVLLRARAAQHGECHVLTTPITLTLGGERIVGLVVQPESEPAPPAPAAALHAPKLAGYDPSAYTIDGDEQTRQLIIRWPVIFKECANLDKSILFTHYFEWMGKIREMAMQPIVEPLGAQLATGQWGMVTNGSAVRVLGEAQLGDTIEVRYWVQRAPHQPDATIDLRFDWRRIDRQGRQERIALGEMRTTWVALIGHGQVRAEPMPDYFQAFIDARTPPDAARFRPEPLPEPLAGATPGALLFERPAGPTPGPLLARRTFETSLQDSNLVGNIYFANYYTWQARLIDQYLYGLIPQTFRAMGALGALRCVATRVDHLVDAMPFDTIEVSLSLDALHECGVTFGFDYFRVQPDGSRQKLAVGRQECLWITRQTGVSHPGALPAALRDDLLQQLRQGEQRR